MNLFKRILSGEVHERRWKERMEAALAAHAGGQYRAATPRRPRIFDDVHTREECLALRERIFESAIGASGRELDHLILQDRQCLQRWPRRKGDPPPLAHRLAELRALEEERGIVRPTFTPYRPPRPRRELADRYRVVAASGTRGVGEEIGTPRVGEVIQIGGSELRVRRIRRERDDRHLRVTAGQALLRLEPVEAR